ncbi:T9SS sorting signal type C domain-containing protein [Flavobacterium sp. 25HG05S-40]|uniref:T9SS sorting signal type C domain-containing protein n=1 Tax=Flavobacterium sp. 25HG05S-40 TaxID=3458682 RepID=UPI004044517B
MKTLVQNSKVTAVVFVLFCFFQTSNLFAQVTTLQNWSNLYNATGSGATTAYTVPAGSGSNRVLVVAIASSQSAVAARTVSITYGGQAMTLASGNMGTTTIRQHTAIYYLNEAGLDAASGSNLIYSITGGTTRGTTVWAAVFDYVDQTTSLTNTRNYDSGTTQVGTFAFGTALTINANDQAIYVLSSVRNANLGQRSLDTLPANFTNENQQDIDNTDGIRNAVLNRTVPTSNTSSTCSTVMSGNSLGSMTGVSLKGCSQATANAGSALSAICQGGTSAGLGGSIGGSATGGTWSSSVAGGTFTPSATNLNATWTPPTAFSGNATLTLTTSGGSCGIATASKTLRVNPVPTAVTASSSASTICSGGNFNLTSSATSNSPTVPLLNENFNSAPAGWTTTNTSTLGTPANAAWTLRANGYTYDVDVFNSNDASQFYLSNSDAQGSGSTTATTLQSPSFSTFGLSAASLSFFHYFRNVSTDSAIVQVSTDGVNWTAIATYTGASEGADNAFAPVTISLASYLNQPTVSIRFKYDATWDWYWAIDNVTVTGTVIPTTYAWTSTPSGFTSSTQNPTGVAPIVNTAYNVEVTNAFGCKASASTSSVTVNPRPTASVISGSAAICSGSPTNIQVAITGGTSPYSLVYSGGSASGYVSGTNISVAPTSTTTYTLTSVTDANGCVGIGNSGSAVVTIDATTSTNGGVSWSNGSPSATKSVLFDGSSATLASDFAACSLRLTNNAVVTVSSGFDVTLNGRLTVDSGSTFTLNNNANLIQNNTLTNSGNIVVKRNSSALKRLDYTLWSSPVTGQGLYAFSPFTFGNRFYVYRTNTNLYNNADVGFSLTGLDPNGVNGTDSNNVPFAPAKGYLIRMPWNHPTAATVWNATFTGVPNNGDITYTMTNGGAGQRFNLVGNPYPSPITMSQFVSDNSTKITGTLYFWRETNNNTSNNAYCSWAGGTFTTNSEAQVFNPNGIIRTGQGFFVEATGAATALEFKNVQRSNDNANQFFKTGTNVTNDVDETNRFWLNLTNTSGAFSQMAAGYMTNATDGVDLYDGKNINTGNVLLNSILDNTEYTIQGKSLPFNASDVIPLSFKVTTAGSYTIAIDHVDGLFTDGAQPIYLKDNLLVTEHNLQTGAYNFASDAGTFNNRFEIVYQSQLSNPSFTVNTVVIYNQNNEFVINSGTTEMASVKVFDIRGRLLQEKTNINANQTTINGGLSNEVLLVQITSNDGITVTKKVIN